jgi:Type II secretion system (T2SS), protein M subtype b
VTITPRDRRALSWLAVSAVLGLIGYLWTSTPSSTTTVAAADSVEQAEKRLAKLREIAATLPQKEEIYKKAAGDLAIREKGILQADTAQQAQAQMIQIIRRIGRQENPPVEIRTQEIGQVRPLGDAYGEAQVAVQVECHIDQLVNILAALAAQPELIASSDLRVTATNTKDKAIGVRLTLSGVVPRKLVPEKKGVSAF